MKNIKKYLSIALALILIITMIPVNAEAKTVKINKTKATIYVGDTLNLKVSGAKGIKWSTSKKSVATVSNKGKVTAKKAGKANIIAKVGKKKYTCKVTVKNPSLNKTKVTLNKGESTVLTLNGSKAKSWSSNKTSVATVNSSGKVTATGIGTAKITVKAKNKKNYSCTVTVVSKSDASEPDSETPNPTPNPEPQHTHSYVAKVTKNATCTEDGIRTYTCSCGDSYTEKIVATGHSISNGVCSKCGYVENEEEHFHQYTETITKQATCMDNGIITYTCSCKDSYTKEIPATGHNYVTTVVASTCDTKGYTLHKCKTCNTEYKTDYKDELGHKWNEGTRILTETCNEQGLIQYQCTVCKKYNDVTIPTLEHQLSDWLIFEFCGDVGEKYQRCNVCGKTFNKTILPPTGKHRILSDGSCAECDYYNPDEATHYHNYIETISRNATCAEEGEILYSCQCGNYYTKSIAKLTHQKSDWITDMEATCYNAGSMHKECNVCHEVLEKQEIAQKKHSYWRVNTVESTCITHGYNELACSNCGDLKYEERELVDHIYGNFVETLKPADFYTFGTAKMVCSVCKEVLFDDLTAVLIDLGNGNSTTVYGYYDYEDARKCFDLTYAYKRDNGYLYLESQWTYEWRESSYIYSCIRSAEQICLIETNGIGGHKRPNGKAIEYGCENVITCTNPNFGKHELMEYNAQEAFDLWLSSRGHKDNIEAAVNGTSISKFTGWMPSMENWGVFWTQNF